MFHACFISNATCVYYVFISFWHILLDEPIDKMPSASFCLLCLCIAEKVQNPKCSKNSQKNTEILFRQKTPGARRTSPGGAHSPQEAPRRGLGLAAHGSHLAPSSTASRCLFAYIFSPDLKTSDHRRFSPETHPSTAATKNPNSGDKSSCSGTLLGLGIGRASCRERVYVLV